MKRTGEILRKAREAKGLSINELALSLKINSKALTAIEEGDLSRLPAKTFLRGFVQSYAQALRIDVDEVLNVFAEEMGTTRPQPLIPPGTNAPEAAITLASPMTSAAAEVAPAAVNATPPARPSGKNRAGSDGLAGLEEGNRTRIFAISAIALVLVFLIFGTKKIIDRYQRESETGDVVVSNPIVTDTPLPGAETALTETPMSTPVAAAPGGSTVAAPLTATTAKTESAATAVTPPTPSKPAATPPPPAKPAVTTPAPAKPAAPAETAKPAEPKKPEETKVAEAKKPEEKKPEEKKPEEKKPEEKKTEEAAKPAEAPKPAAAKPVELIIEAMDAVDVEYTNASGAPEKIKLSEGQVHTIRSRGGLKLSVSNGGVVNLILNGRDLGVPGVIGKPVQLNY